MSLLLHGIQNQYAYLMQMLDISTPQLGTMTVRNIQTQESVVIKSDTDVMGHI